MLGGGVREDDKFGREPLGVASCSEAPRYGTATVAATYAATPYGTICMNCLASITQSERQKQPNRTSEVKNTSRINEASFIESQS